VSLQVEGVHVLIGNFDAGSVVLGHKMRLNLESGSGFGLPNVVQSEIKRA